VSRVSPRAGLVLGALFTAAGLGLAATAPGASLEVSGSRGWVGGVLVLAGWAVLVVSIHRFGRAGGQAGR
jgi:hypothetical protein